MELRFLPPGSFLILLPASALRVPPHNFYHPAEPAAYHNHWCGPQNPTFNHHTFNHHTNTGNHRPRDRHAGNHRTKTDNNHLVPRNHHTNAYTRHPVPGNHRPDPIDHAYVRASP